MCWDKLCRKNHSRRATFGSIYMHQTGFQLFYCGGASLEDRTSTANCTVFDGQSWKPAPSMPRPLRSNACAAFNGASFTCGGEWASSVTKQAFTKTLRLQDGDSTNACYSYDDMQWSDEVSLRSGRSQHSIVSYNGRTLAEGACFSVDL